MKNENISSELTPIKAASLLTYLPRIRDELKSQRIHSALDYKGLTVAFLPNRDFPDPLFGGLDNLLGNEHCAGIRVIGDNESFEDAYDDAHQKLDAITKENNQTLRENTRVAVLSIDDIKHWISFENEVKTKKLDERVGNRIWAESGLRRLDWERHAGQESLFSALMEQNKPYLQSMGVEYKEVGETWPGVGVFCKNGNDEDLEPVFLYNVKTGEVPSDETKSEILVEKVLVEPVLVPAVVIRSVGESKREAYTRASQVKQFIIEKYGYSDVEIPVISAGQIAAWNKLGFLSPIETYIPNDELTWSEVVRFTHLGEDNMHPGPFTLEGISLFWSNHEYGVDGLFMGREGFEHRYVPKDGVQALAISGGELVPKTLDTVGALLIVPEDADVEILKKQYVEPAQQLLKPVFGEKVNIALITPSYFREVWMEEGPFVKSDEPASVPRLVNFLNERKFRRTKNVRNDVKNGLHLPSLQPQIGAQRVMFNVDDSLILSDFGKSFIDGPSAYRNAYSRPRTSSGMMLGLESGEYEAIPGLYSMTWLQQTIDGLVGWVDSPRNIPSFLRSQFMHRMPSEDIINLLGKEKARKLFSVGKLDEEKFYGGHNYSLALFLLSHNHADHAGNMPFMAEPEFGSYMTEPTNLLLHWQTNRAGSSLNANLLLANPNVKIGSAYEKMARQINIVDGNGEVVRFPGGYWFQMRRVDHSSPGAVSTLFGYPNGVTALVTNDVKAGPDTDTMVNDFAGKADIIVFEATNLPEGDKASASVTEEDVYQSLRYNFAEIPRGPIIIEVATDNIERLLSIFAVAAEFGRKVYVDARTMSLLSEINSARKEYGYIPGLDMTIPTPDQVGLYLPHMKTERPYARSLRVIAEQNQAGAGVIDPERLIEDGDQAVVITSPFRSHIQDLKVTHAPNGITVIHSAPFPYETDAKNRVRDNYNYITSIGGRYIGDFSVTGGDRQARVAPILDGEHPVHASGHFPFHSPRADENIQPQIKSTTELIKGLLEGREHKYTYLFSVHNESPGLVVQEVKDNLKAAGFNMNNLIFPQITRYDVDVPWSWHVTDTDRLKLK